MRWPLVFLVLVLLLYVVVPFPEVNWGSSVQALAYRKALTGIQELVHVQDHVKNYRPQLLVLSGSPATRPALIDFAHLISRNSTMVICGHVARVSNTLPRFPPDPIAQHQ